MKMKLHFSTDWNFLCQLFIQKEYEYLTQNKEKEYNQIHYYPFWDLFQKKILDNYDFESDLTDFLSNHLHLSTKTPVNADMLVLFAREWIKKQMEHAEYVEAKNAIMRRIYLKKREKEFFATYDSGVWNKETDEMVKASFGEHWCIILRMLEEKFGEYASMENDRFDEFDKWIKENIVLTGNYRPQETYHMHVCEKS